MKEKKNTLLIAAIILVIVAALGGWYFGSKYEILERENKENNKQPVDNSEDLSNTGEQNNPSLSNNNKYVGNYGAIIDTGVDEDGDGINDRSVNTLYLREDGTFKYSVNTYTCSSPSVGTYSIDENKIILEEKVKYGCDACFFTSDLNTITATIKDDNTLVMVYLGKTLEYVNGISPSEDEDSKLYYVINPKDGESPSENSETWMDCTNQTIR